MNRPQPVLTAAEMRAAEQRLFDSGTSVDELMQRAGQGAAEWVWRVAAGRSVTVLCGPGNNGGDGYVIAETLRQRGLEVTVVAPLQPGTDAARSARQRYGGGIADTACGAVFVDCLFGTGLTRPLSGELAALLNRLARAHDYSIAVDLPSGVHSDTGEVLNDAMPHYQLTQALGAWKRAHWVMPGMARMGERRLVAIGIEAPDAAALLSARPMFWAPSADAHKYKRGLMAVIGGAMPGAGVLASEAAMRAGAGYVKLLADRSHSAAPADLVIEEGSLTQALQDERIGAVLIGPGLGRSEDSRRQLQRVLVAGCALILDADALVLLKRDDLAGRRTPAILTPHAGELAKLCQTFGIAEENKVARAEALAQATGAVVLAKGPDNVLTDGERLRFFPTAPSWLSTAGTGDVLAGIIGSRLAHTADPFRAAEEAVWLHSEAARLCGAVFTAGELAHSVSAAYEAFL